MKSFASLLLLFALCSVAVAEFHSGERVRLTNDEPLYFKDAVHRKGTSGEEFVVHTHNTKTGKVFVIITDTGGKQMALNIRQEALASIPAAPPIGSTTAATPARGVDGVLGIPWGAARDQVTQTMLEREGVTLDEKRSKDTTLAFSGGRFAGMSGLAYFFYFFEDKLCKAVVFLNADDRHPVSDYTSVRKLLVEKYGKPNGSFSFYSRPYHDGDGYEAQAIRADKGRFADYWFFPTEEAPQSVLSSEITTSLAIRISYEHSATAKKFYDKNKEKRKSDL